MPQTIKLHKMVEEIEKEILYKVTSSGYRDLLRDIRQVESDIRLIKKLLLSPYVYGELERNLKQKLESCDLLVNTTSVGMEHDGKDPTVSPVEILPSSGFVSDIIYRPAKTKLLRDAEAAGLAIQNGLPMLVYQGAEAFEIWTQKTAPVELMYKAALAALAE